MNLPFHYTTNAHVTARPESLFAYLDDQARLSSHMTRSSWQMGGGRMGIDIDAGGGQRVGSHIRMTGRVLGITLSLDEVVVDREPPFRKAWETVGEPRLLVIGPYRMGFTVQLEKAGSRLEVFIEYALPNGFLAGRFGRLLGGFYARWCTRRMVDDAVAHFRTALSVGSESLSQTMPEGLR